MLPALAGRCKTHRVLFCCLLCSREEGDGLEQHPGITTWCTDKNPKIHDAVTLPARCIAVARAARSKSHVSGPGSTGRNSTVIWELLGITFRDIKEIAARQKGAASGWGLTPNKGS